MMAFLGIRLKSLTAIGAVLVTALCATQSHAVELDWSGQFRTEFNSVWNYTLDGTPRGDSFQTNRYNADGYYIPSGGSNRATFNTLFLELRPKVVVNDNIYIKSEFWVGDPVYGMYGNGVPSTTDRRQYNSTFANGASITAARFWAELQSDMGTFQFGRVPLHWGLGLVWNSGDNLWDRYQSTGDAIRLISKFGAFSFVPSIITYSFGDSVSGACDYSGATPVCSGRAGISDYSLILKYESPERDFELGLNFIRRLGGSNPGTRGFLGPLPSASTGSYTGVQGAVTGMSFNTFDFYLTRKFGKIRTSLEAPLVSGDLSGRDYSAFALGAEVAYEPSERWELTSRLGRSPGQINSRSQVPDKMTLLPFHPGYRLGLIMFNYQLANFGGPSNDGTGQSDSALRSPYDNPISNVNYLALGTKLKTDKWTFNGDLIFASALQTAQSGQFFYNQFRRRMSTVTARAAQESFMGWEMDYGAQFQWDDYMVLRLDAGFFFPGSYYKFSNVAGNPNDNPTAMAFAAAARVGINF